VVSTPFWYAEELLADDRGALVPFRDPAALSRVLGELLGRPDLCAAMENRARAYGEQMRWPNVARVYTNLFEAARRARGAPLLPLRLPALTLSHVAVLTDGTGVLQHALVAVPNPLEGYTTDDNARALQLAVLAGDDPTRSALCVAPSRSCTTP
jgi:hypothetical protein